MSAIGQILIERYRCPETFLNLSLRGSLSEDSGFFRFYPDTTCYGRSSSGHRKSRPDSSLYDVAKDVVLRDAEVCLPFNPTEIIENLRLERYTTAPGSTARAIGREAYYLVRPMLHRSMRRQIQRFQLRNWRRLAFPHWPVDRTVENICERLLLLVIQATGAARIPFIWFWPQGSPGCVIMTHDVETESGRDHCADLMDIDNSFGIKASFQIVPERRYVTSPSFLAMLRNGGFEIAIQDLNHDGRLFSSRNEFLRRAKLINQYAKDYGAKGFRAGALYRRTDWYDALEFSFDMSIPNVAHLDPQRGGCCTVMPYFIGNILELPVTMTQDYMLFHLLSEHSLELWKKQIDLILEKNGLVSFIVHPDYLIENQTKSLYKDLLMYLRELKNERRTWVTLPSEVDRWWRARSKMQVVSSGNEWHIEGEGSEFAVLAFAKEVEGKLVCEIEAPTAKLGIP